ncbi:MAG: hypothetical protein JJU00_10555, partial [Opitutales bacterium]|nr:hypothetical protein [Opitutales bacterium]
MARGYGGGIDDGGRWLAERRIVARSDFRAATRRVFAAAGAIRTGAAGAGTAGPGARMARGYGGGIDDGGRWL